MIRSFGDKETQRIWEGRRSRKLPSEVQEKARRKLRILNNARDLNDLKVPPANRLEKLSGKMKGLFSIRIDEQWRLIFRWERNNAFDVRIADYHK